MQNDLISSAAAAVRRIIILRFPTEAFCPPPPEQTRGKCISVLNLRLYPNKCISRIYLPVTLGIKITPSLSLNSLKTDVCTALNRKPILLCLV